MQFTNIQIKTKGCLVERLATLGLGTHWKVGRTGLVEKTESHVVIFFLLGFLFFLLLLSSRSSGASISTSSGSSGGTTTTSHGGKLGQALGHQLLHRLASELLDNNGKSGVIRFNTNRAEDSLDAVGSNLITAEGSEKSCGYVTHV